MSRAAAIAALVLLLGAAAPAPVRAQASEADLKAAFVYNFAQFTDWSHIAVARPLAICGAVSAPQLAALRRLEGRRIGGRAVEVRPAGSGTCDVLLYQPGLAPVATAALTVCDGGPDACRGAVISLVRDGDRIRFDIDASAARGRALSLSSRLLRLARQVR